MLVLVNRADDDLPDVEGNQPTCLSVGNLQLSSHILHYMNWRTLKNNSNGTLLRDQLGWTPS